MSEYIDTEKFYADAVKWESEALTVLASLDPNVDYTEYVKWSVILNERTSFKHDIMDAPKVDVEEVRHGEWIKDESEIRGDGEIYDYCCSLCKSPAAEGSYGNRDVLTPYCSQCGAKMNFDRTSRILRLQFLIKFLLLK